MFGWGGLSLELYQLRNRLAVFFSVGNIEFRLSLLLSNVLCLNILLQSQYKKNALIVLILGELINQFKS